MAYRQPLSHEELFRMLAVANKEKEASAQRIKELQEELGNRPPKPTFEEKEIDHMVLSSKLLMEQECARQELRKRMHGSQVDPSGRCTLRNVYPEESEKTPKKLPWWRQRATMHEVAIGLWAVGLCLALLL